MNKEDKIYLPFGNAIFVLILEVISTYAFYFTEWGRNMVFERDTGTQVFTMSFICAIISFIAILNVDLEFKNELCHFSFTAQIVWGTYVLLYFGIIVISLIECISKDELTILNVIVTLIGGIFATGVAGPFCLIETFVVYIARLIKYRLMPIAEYKRDMAEYNAKSIDSQRVSSKKLLQNQQFLMNWFDQSIVEPNQQLIEDIFKCIDFVVKEVIERRKNQLRNKNGFLLSINSVADEPLSVEFCDSGLLPCFFSERFLKCFDYIEYHSRYIAEVGRINGDENAFMEELLKMIQKKLPYVKVQRISYYNSIHIIWNLSD